eukprot:g3878.t1
MEFIDSLDFIGDQQSSSASSDTADNTVTSLSPPSLAITDNSVDHSSNLSLVSNVNEDIINSSLIHDSLPTIQAGTAPTIPTKSTDKGTKQVSTASKKRGSKKKRDPRKPKRARSAYTFFVQEHRTRIQEVHPKLDFANVGKILGKAWKKCKDNGHSQHYEELAKKDKIRADRERQIYEKSRPKKPISAYMFFVKENRPKISRRHPHLNFAEIGKLMGAAWKRLRDKSKFEKLAEQDKLRVMKARAKEGQLKNK